MRTAGDTSFTETFERQLQSLQTAGGATEGLFGPASMTWQVDREAIAFLGAGRALLLQLAHPWVAIAIAEHSRTGIDPIGRFHRTFAVVYTMVFGARDRALAAARALHARHAAISGTMPADFGPFARGSRYCANELNALRWVYATLIDTAVLAHDMVLAPLTDGEREGYYAESKRFAALFGIAPQELPENWTGFAAYNAAMWDSAILTVTPAARDIARQLLSAPRTMLRAPRWYRAVTAAMLPPSLRAPFDLPFGDAERRVAERAVARIRKLYPRLPARLRYVAPYHEALARLAGRRPDPVTRLLNRIWIGRPVMADNP